MTLLVLATVLLSLTAATVNAASPASSATNVSPAVGAATHPIGYAIAGPPSMIDSGSLAYFKAHGFSTVELIAPDSGTYQTELNTIKALGMQPVIDVEAVIWSGGRLQSTPIASFGPYFQSLKNAGWQYVASEGGRQGDLTYLKQFFKGYVNYNCDQCGLWLDVYKNPFTVINSWESYYTPEWSSVQQGATQAAARGIQNGIMAGLWANSGGDNPVLANSLSGGSPSYKSMLDWSYANGVGFTQFCVWCSQDSHVLSDYEHLGFPQIVANLQVEYPPTSSAQTSSPAQTSSRLPTALALTPSTTTATVNQRVTFTASLRGSTTPLSSESATIYHYLNGVRYNDLTAKTGNNGQIALSTSFGFPGQRTYYATFAGDNSYQSSKSNAVTVNVTAKTRVTLAASNVAPGINQYVTFTATLSWWNPAIGKWVATSGKPIQIWHTLKGVRYNVVTKATNASGKVTFTQKWTSPGKRLYYATFTGDTWYKASTSAALTITVN
ncbi:MAG: Ig-like domain-containing protein [Halobacteriota archaeon]